MNTFLRFQVIENHSGTRMNQLGILESCNHKDIHPKGGSDTAIKEMNPEIVQVQRQGSSCTTPGWRA